MSSNRSQFQSKASAKVEHPIPSGMVLGACIEAVSIHCDRASSRRRIYLHIMDHCRMTGQDDALHYGENLDSIYDTLYTASQYARKALDDNVQRIAENDDDGASDHPYQPVNQTVDLTATADA